jgi:replicative DNA helicase
MDNYRLELEQTIIGACLLEDAYQHVAGIITYKNFKAGGTQDHQAIFKAFEEMYPLEPIDPLTVTHKLRKPFYASYLVQCTSKVVSSLHLTGHAFILIQLSMRDVLIHLLNTQSQKEFSTVTKAAINEIIDECLDGSNDILTIYEKTPEYLKSIGSEENLIHQLENLGAQFISKLKSIKNKAHVDSLFNNLKNLQKNSIDVTSRLCLAHLSKLYKDILIAGTVSDSTAAKVLELHI